MRKLEEPAIRINVHLYRRDIARIKAMFAPRMKFNTAVRELVRQMLDRIEEQAKGSHEPIPALDLELEEQ